MALSSPTASSGPYACNGAQTVFSYAFKVFDEADLDVVLTDADGVDTPLTLNSDYTVSGVGDANGGDVTTLTTYASGNTITIRRDMPMTQGTTFSNQGSILTTVIETALDKISMALLQLRESLSRGLSIPSSDGALDMVLPRKTERAGKYAGYDANGLPIAIAGEVGSVPVTAFMETVLAASTSAAARSALDVPDGRTETVSGAKTLVADDMGKHFACDASGGAFALSLLSAVAATGIYTFLVSNAGASGNVTLSPDGSEKINGADDLVLSPGMTALLHSDGANWQAIVGQPVPIFGQCRLVYTNSTTLTLQRFNGKFLTVDGQAVEVPAAGVTVDTTGLATSTTYFVYAYVSSGTLTLELSATSHTKDSATGVEIKSGDATRTLVGMARTNGSTQFVHSGTQRFVRSWFNDRPLYMESAFTAQRTTASNTLSELNTEIRCEFLLWDDDLLEGGLSGYSYNSTTDYCVATVGIDGAGTKMPAVGSVNYGTEGGTVASFGTRSGLSEGYHYATFLGANGDNSSTARFGISSAFYGRLSVAIIPSSGR